MKLLYLSCHAILEYDELKIFEELGIDYFSLGSYLIPKKPVDAIRPPLKHEPDRFLLEHTPDRRNIPQSFFEKFDVIVIMHGDVPEGNWIIDNWDKMKHKRVIWRTIGQSNEQVEAKLFKYRREGLQVVRYSKREANIPNNIGSDKVIPFYKDPLEFNNWNGAGNEVITIAQDMKHRGQFCNWDFFEQVTKGYNAKVYGPRNENAGDMNGGFLSYDGMRQKLRDARAYIYTGTQPASYTLNFIEAMMTGVPVIATGPQHANSLDIIKGDIYAIPDVINIGINGFWTDDVNQAREWVEFLLKNKQAAQRIGAMGRQRAIDLFGKEVIKSKWKEFLGL